MYTVLHEQITQAHPHTNVHVVTNPPPFSPSVTRCESTREAMLLCVTRWVTRRGVRADEGEQQQLARGAANEVDRGLCESVLFLGHPAKSGAFL